VVTQHALVCVLENVEFVIAAHEGGERLLPGVDAGPAPWRHHPPDRHRIGLTLYPDRGQLLVVEHPPGRPVGGLADDDPVYGGNALQACGGVDHVADHTLGLVGRVQADQRFTGRDADPYRQL
jgi:hypothetical protein